MKVLVTGADGFIGKNLVLKLSEFKEHQILTFVKEDSPETLSNHLLIADVVVHLAGENRPPKEDLFAIVNVGLTKTICQILRKSGRTIPFIFSSSQQAKENNPYGHSKLTAEEALKDLTLKNGNTVFIYRLPGVFGKWCKPNYNSVVATFCNQIANDLPIQIDNPNTNIQLVYIDDVIKSFLWAINHSLTEDVVEVKVFPEYQIELQDLASQIKSFKKCRKTLISERVGHGLIRALYATYLSYLPNEKFSYELPVHGDERGVFVEILKTRDAGQFSFFTAHPGITRGGHYHDTKSEKFLVIRGLARFRFRHMISDETISIDASGEVPMIVETIPGWAHDITNIGDEDVFVMLWANEIFDPNHPDTVVSEV